MPIPDMKTVLLTGFEPWQEFKTNPSQQIAERLNGESIGGAQIVSLTLPVVFGEDTSRLFPGITDLKPSLVLMLGLAAGTPCLDVERFGVNLRISDSDPSVQQEIIPGGPGAYLATLDVERIAQAIRDRAEVPARAHGYAGSFLCNHVLYQTLNFAKTNSLLLKAGFIHLPQSSEQAVTERRLGMPSLPLDMMVQGVRIAIEEAIALR
jgi:pyroglutamyl-peptidase